MNDLISEQATMVLFESPHRIQAMLTDLEDILGDREIVMLREMTKKYEEVKRDSVSRVLKQLGQDEIRGEFTLVVAGKEKSEDGDLLDKKIQQTIEDLLRQRNMSVREIARKLSEEERLTYRRLYKECLSIKRAMGWS